MEEAQICVSWDLYKNHVSQGFAHLQQNAEFVDMTLAAEGHLVKVHQNVVALASPYLKAMLQSASCQHPVIFLNNVSHRLLGYILEYIYTGEVQIPSNETDKFIKACRSLCIMGVENINVTKNIPKKEAESSIERYQHFLLMQRVTEGSCQIQRIEKPPDNEFAAHITINSQENNYNLELLTNENKVIHGNNTEMTAQAPTSASPTPDVGEMDYEDYEAALDNNNDVNGIRHFVILKPSNESSNDKISNPNVINANNPITILPVETITPSILQTNTNNLFSQFDTTARNPSEIILDAHALQFNRIEDSFNNIPGTHPAEIILNTKDLLGNPRQASSNAMPEITLNTTDLLGNSIQASSNAMPKITLNTTDLLGNPRQASSNAMPKFTLNTTDLLGNPRQPSANAMPKITLNTTNLLGNSIQASSNVHPVDIVINTDESSEAGLDNVKIKLDTNQQTMNATDCIPNILSNIQVSKRGVNKNIKKLRSHIRLNKNQEDKTTLLNMCKSDIIKMDGKTHFTVSNRGSIQMILNRFIYHSHHHSHCGRKRRWRCIDYRKIHCPAFIDTDNDVIIATEENHCHPNHDNQIRKKIKENVIFTTMTTAVNIISTFNKKENS